MKEQLSNALQEALDKSGPVLLPYSFVSVLGPDSAKFLQGQTSGDIQATTNYAPNYGTANTPKGRMYGLFRIIRWQDGFLLCMHQDIAEHFVAQIAKYAAFFKCEVQIETELKSYGKSAASEQSAESVCSFEPFAGIPLVESWERYTDSLPSVLIPLSEDWSALASCCGIPELYPETLENFVLQHLNLQEFEAVSFNKGCYTGQEIIARMKYLGKLKKRMFMLTSDDTSATFPKPGATLSNQDGKKVGELVRVHRSSLINGVIALAVLDLGFAEQSQQVFVSEPSQIVFSL